MTVRGLVAEALAEATWRPLRTPQRLISMHFFQPSFSPMTPALFTHKSMLSVLSKMDKAWSYSVSTASREVTSQAMKNTDFGPYCERNSWQVFLLPSSNKMTFLQQKKSLSLSESYTIFSKSMCSRSMDRLLFTFKVFFNPPEASCSKEYF